MAGEQEARRIGHAQHPLPHRSFGENLVNQERGRLGHASRTPAGADAAPFAAEGHQVLGTAGVAAHPKEAVLQAAALEVSL
jgi:hypothetical protein